LKSATGDLGDSDARELEHSLTSLLHLSDSLNSIFDLETLLDALVEQMLELTDAETGCAGLRTPNGMACSHFLQGSSIVPLMYECGPGLGWPGWVLTHGTCYLTNDALNDAMIVPEIRERFGVISGMSIPIVDGEQNVIAFVEVYNKRSGGEFTPLDLRNGMAAAKIAALAIKNGLTWGQLTAVAAFSRSLTLASDLEQILDVVAHHFEINFHRRAVILLPADRSLAVRHQASDFVATAMELEAAAWCWKHTEETGAETTVIPDALAHYFPLTVRGEVMGVLGLISAGGSFSAPRRELLAGFIGQSALAIEHGVLEQRMRRLRFLDESDRLQNALLAAISHEVRAPLAAITASVSGLLSAATPLDQQHERQLLRTAEAETKRLHRLMNNLLNVTRLQAGVSRLKLEPCDLSDVVGAALEELEASTRKNNISIDIPQDLPLVQMDFNLITQVLVNLFSNALKFSPAEGSIQLQGRTVGDKLEVAVADRGRGIPEEDLPRVFQKFHRLAESSSVDGLGLGLSICKEFVEAHGGRIQLENNPGGGTIARFVLPVQASSAFA
jgi:signal transduction histidine kinase